MPRLLPLDELNQIRTEILRTQTVTSDGKVKFEADKCDDLILDLLLTSYAFGCEDANEQLGTEIAPTMQEMGDSVNRKVGGANFHERVHDYAINGDLEAIMKVADTESHRCYNEAVQTTGEVAVSDYGLIVYKRWNTMMDERVRDTHSYLEGVRIPLDAEFTTYDGDKAFAPGGFANADNNINCRCLLSLSV